MVYNLHITTDEAGALLELSDSLADQLEGVVEAFNRTIHPAGGYRVYETIHLDADGFVLEGIPFHTGRKIAHALRGSSSLAVVSITLGEDISRLIEQYNKEFDFITAYWLDKLSNWALEQLMRLLKQELQEEVAKDHLKITSHWGPVNSGIVTGPHDWASTTARLGFNDRTIGPQRPVNAKVTTARFSCNRHYSF